MKFFSSLRLALHNLWNNKSRSVLTVVIVFVVSTLIMALLLIGTNFVENVGRANTLSFELRGTSYSLNSYDAKNYEKYSTFEECMTILDKAAEYPFAVSGGHMLLDTYSAGFTEIRPEISDNGSYIRDVEKAAFSNFSLPLNIKDGTFVEGSSWNKEDEGTDGIWLTREYVGEKAKEGINYEIGQKIKYYLLVSKNQRDSKYILSERDYTLRGIVDTKEEGKFSNQSNFLGFISARYALSEEQKKLGVGWSGITLFYNPTAGTFNYNIVEKQLKAFTDEVNEIIGKGLNYEGKEIDRFSCSYLDDSFMSRMMGLIIMAVVILLSFLILILSIGSVANTIIISVDKNKKFIGLMMAMGLNNRGVKKIVHKEAFVQILIGVLLAVAVILLAQNLMIMLLNQMLGAMFMSMLGGTEFLISFSIGFYVPIGMFVIFVLMALAFSKGALNKMGKADIISVISEVS